MRLTPFELVFGAGKKPFDTCPNDILTFVVMDFLDAVHRSDV